MNAHQAGILWEGVAAAPSPPSITTMLPTSSSTTPFNTSTTSVKCLHHQDQPHQASEPHHSDSSPQAQLNTWSPSKLKFTSKSYCAPHNFNFVSFPQPRDKSINYAARIPGTAACSWQSRTQWWYILCGALLVASSALDLSLATGDENQIAPKSPTCQLLLSTTDESASTFGLKLPPFSLSRSSFEVEMSWNVLLPASLHILILARKQSAAIKLWPKLRRSSLLGNQFSILSIYLAPLPNLWLLPSFFSDTSQLSPQIAKPFSRADHSAK